MCKISYYKDKQLIGDDCNGADDKMRLAQIHGFYHITNLDFNGIRRGNIFWKLFVGDYKFSRKWDDLIGVTLPAVFGPPNKS